MTRWVRWTVATGLILVHAPMLLAQQATVGLGFSRMGDSFSEQIGVGWGLRFPGGFAQFNPPAAGGGGNAAPAGGGLAFGDGSFGGFLAIAASQGSRRSSVMQSTTVTIPNGGTGFVSDSLQRPFVVGVVPVIGGAPQLAPPLPRYGTNSVLDERLSRLKSGEATSNVPSARRNSQPAPIEPAGAKADKIRKARASSAGRSAASLDDIRKEHSVADAERRQEARQLLARGAEAQAAGKTAAAKIYYQMAARRAGSELQREIAQRIQSLKPLAR